MKLWLKDHAEDIDIHYLQAHLPALNPDKYLNCDLKHGGAQWEPHTQQAGSQIEDNWPHVENSENPGPSAQLLQARVNSLRGVTCLFNCWVNSQH